MAFRQQLRATTGSGGTCVLSVMSCIFVRLNVDIFLICQPEGQVEWDVHGPQSSCSRVQQTNLGRVHLPALTGHTVHPHQMMASVQ